MQAQWENRLRAEDLAPLDCENHGRPVVSSRGSIKPRDSVSRARLEEREAEREHRRTVAATRPARHAWQRRALALYAVGTGYKRIARLVRQPDRRVLRLLEPRGAREASEPTLITQCETLVLMRLLGAFA